MIENKSPSSQIIQYRALNSQQSSSNSSTSRTNNDMFFLSKDDLDDYEEISNGFVSEPRLQVKSKTKLNTSSNMQEEIDFTLNEQLEKQTKYKRKIELESSEEFLNNSYKSSKSSKLDSNLHDDLNTDFSTNTTTNNNNQSKSISFYPIPVNFEHIQEQFNTFTNDTSKYFKITCMILDSKIHSNKNQEKDFNNNNLTYSDKLDTQTPLITDLLIKSSSPNTYNFLGMTEVLN